MRGRVTRAGYAAPGSSTSRPAARRGTPQAKPRRTPLPTSGSRPSAGSRGRSTPTVAPPPERSAPEPRRARPQSGGGGTI